MSLRTTNMTEMTTLLHYKIAVIDKELKIMEWVKNNNWKRDGLEVLRQNNTFK